MDGNVIQSYTYSKCNSDSYIAHNETVTLLNTVTSKISLKEKFDSLKIKFINDHKSMKESLFFGNKFIQNGNVAAKSNASESIDSSEKIIKQLQNEIIFLGEEWRNKNNIIKCVLDQLSKGDGNVCSNTECYSYRKSANDSILSTNEKKALQ